MASRTENGFVQFTAGEALEPNRRVKLGSDSRTVVYADASDLGIGTTCYERVASGDPVTVRLDNAGGTANVEVGADIADKAELYAAADGKVAGSGTVKVGILFDPDDKAEDGAILEYMPYASRPTS